MLIGNAEQVENRHVLEIDELFQDLVEAADCEDNQVLVLRQLLSEFYDVHEVFGGHVGQEHDLDGFGFVYCGLRKLVDLIAVD